MKKNLFVLFTLIFIQYQAQDYLGFVNSNYSGITGVQLNPANVVNSRMRFDATLIGINLNVANNYVGLKRSALDHDGSFISAVKRASKGDANAFPAFRDTAFQQHYLRDVINGKNKSLFISNRITLPSFMFNINQSNAIGISINMRTYVNLDGVSEELARLLYSDVGRMADYNVNDILGKDISNKHFSANAITWLEYGLTYGHVFKSDGKHFFKAGITPKLLQGLAAAYMNIKDFRFRFDNDPVRIQNDSLQLLAVIKTEVNYGHSRNLEIPDPNAPVKTKNPFANSRTLYGTFTGWPKFESYPGFGLDAGFVYEWRPHYQDYKFDMDGKKNLWRRDKNKYKLKMGLSILDLGSIKFDKGDLSQDFTINVDTIKYRLLETQSYPVYDIDRIIDSLIESREVEKTFKVYMPTALSAQIDYHIWKDFYINLTPYIAFANTNKEAKVRDLTNISLSPRWDHKWFGVAVPFSYNTFYAKAGQTIKMGSMLRLGPLLLGTNDLPNFFTGDIFGTNLYFMLKLPIPYGHVRDRDKDAVSDKKDLCVDVAGVWEFKGCPDRDADGIQDKDDWCPDVKGLKDLQGCPDRDGDGIRDGDDDCPDVKGLTDFKGCPDTDNDKIKDSEDECPDVAGLTEFKGCPDTDTDGTQDKEDLCPDVFGPKEYKGCPDKDADKILDKDDACPEQAGPVENKGCPWPDGDKDGVFDKDDSCITVPGIAMYKGCPPPPPPPPPMKAAEKKIIEKAFASLEFATAKDVIKPKSFPSLNALANLLKDHSTDWKLKLVGHTDNEGTPEKNMILSEKRAKAVKNYLVKKGVDPEQIVTEWYGQTMPVADNATPQGRQKNRRVEMKILLRE
jgi:outer membrane protein OmpA-like peptidoglycan-associated protein